LRRPGDFFYIFPLYDQTADAPAPAPAPPVPERDRYRAAPEQNRVAVTPSPGPPPQEKVFVRYTLETLRPSGEARPKSP
jgi:hypothetical protein